MQQAILKPHKEKVDIVGLLTKGIRTIIFGIVLLFALALAAALYSYHPEDPAWTSALQNSDVHNLLGKKGAYFADISLTILGKAAWLIPLCLGVYAYHLIYLGKILKSDAITVIRRLIGILITIFFFAGLLDLTSNSGGIIGSFFGSLVVTAFSWIEAVLGADNGKLIVYRFSQLFLIALTVLGVALASGRSPLYWLDYFGGKILALIERLTGNMLNDPDRPQLNSVKHLMEKDTSFSIKDDLATKPLEIDEIMDQSDEPVIKKSKGKARKTAPETTETTDSNAPFDPFADLKQEPQFSSESLSSEETSTTTPNETTKTDEPAPEVSRPTIGGVKASAHKEQTEKSSGTEHKIPAMAMLPKQKQPAQTMPEEVHEPSYEPPQDLPSIMQNHRHPGGTSSIIDEPDTTKTVLEINRWANDAPAPTQPVVSNSATTPVRSNADNQSHTPSANAPVSNFTATSNHSNPEHNPHLAYLESPDTQRFMNDFINGDSQGPTIEVIDEIPFSADGDIELDSAPKMRSLEDSFEFEAPDFDAPIEPAMSFETPAFETPAFSAEKLTPQIDESINESINKPIDESFNYTPHQSKPITPAFTLNLEEDEPEFSVDNSEPTILNLDDEPNFNREPSFDEEYASALAELDLPTEANESADEDDGDDFAPTFDDSAFNNAFGDDPFSEPSFNEPSLNVAPDNAPHFENEPTFDDEPDFEVPYSDPAPSPTRPQPVHVEGFAPPSQFDGFEVDPRSGMPIPKEKAKVYPMAGQLPSPDLLGDPPPHTTAYDDDELLDMAELIETQLKNFNVGVKVENIEPGPVITCFELDLAPGVKVAQINNLEKDIARLLSVTRVRVVDIIPGKPYVGLEIPNKNRETVYFKDGLTSEVYREATHPLTMILGKDTSGNHVVANLAKMPHLLVAGTTGSGKSVGINTMLLSLLYKARPEELRLILIDPKMLELSVYNEIPHLLAPVVTDMNESANALRWCVAEMERRYQLMSQLKVRNIAGYNKKVQDAIDAGQPLIDPTWNRQNEVSDYSLPPTLEPLPFIVIVIDEFADMMMLVGKKCEELIARLAQKARASGIHLILATQRPSVDVITGLIKANIPSRIAFQVSSRIDSRTILDQQGAETLLGHGDMLYLPPGLPQPIRIHGAFVDDHEVNRIVEFLKQTGPADYIEEILREPTEPIPGLSEEAAGVAAPDDSKDPLFDEAVKIVVESQRASISYVQRRLRVGYQRAARMIEEMESLGFISEDLGNGNRDILIKAFSDD
ncbi:MAG: hypothetical protein GX667_03175 [Xanthomonadaceae bacterium]|nr:hypothetical protein [Xanthomonadaceae bacterium]